MRVRTEKAGAVCPDGIRNMQNEPKRLPTFMPGYEWCNTLQQDATLFQITRRRGGNPMDRRGRFSDHGMHGNARVCTEMRASPSVKPPKRTEPFGGTPPSVAGEKG